MSYLTEKRPITIFFYIFGTLVEHAPPWDATKPSHLMKLLPGTLTKIEKWERAGYNIILTTGRRESLRTQTENQLSQVGIIYDQLIMGIGGGERYLINDRKPNGKKDYATAINLIRNQGIQNLDL